MILGGTRLRGVTFFRANVHIGVDLHRGLIHSVIGMAPSVAGVVRADDLLHSKEELVLSSASYQGRREEHQGRDVRCCFVLRPSLCERRSRTCKTPMKKESKAGLWAEVEPSVQSDQAQSDCIKIRFCKQVKKMVELKALFVLFNLPMVRLWKKLCQYSSKI